MKQLFLSLSVFFSVLCCQNAISQVWQDETGGISDREFLSVAAGHESESTIYAGTTAGLYKKSSPDENWKQIFTCSGQYKGVNHILADRNSINIATANGLYKSADSGRTWKRIFRGEAGENQCVYISFGPKDKTTIYLGTAKGLFWAENDGKAWKRPLGALSSSKITCIACSEKEGRAHIFVISDNELYKATRDLKSYKKMFGSSSFKSFQDSDVEAEDNIREESDAVFLVSHVTESKGILYLSTNRGVFSSSDAGESWSKLGSAGLVNRHVNYITASPKDETIYAATKNGIFAYERQTDSWNRIDSGMDSADARQIMFTKKNDLWAACKRKIYKMRSVHPPIRDDRSSDVDRIMSRFDREPTINETMNMAINYAEVHPDKIAKWRNGAKFRALLPKFSLGIDRGMSDTYEIYTSSSNSYWVNGPQDKSEGWNANLSWDLADLIWNESQTSIDVRSKLMVQLRDDIVDEVNRAYFERRRLQIELAMKPPSDLDTLLKKRLRVEELTASLDGLTGNRFSKAIERKQ